MLTTYCMASLIATLALGEMRSSVQHMYVSQSKVGTNRSPEHSGYVYSKYNDSPGTYMEFGTSDGDYKYGRPMETSVVTPPISMTHERLKSLAEMDEAMARYGGGEFHIDDEDVRTNSMGSYDVWPFFYHTPYEFLGDMETIKDKRYVEGTTGIIPVYEPMNGELPPKYSEIKTDIYNQDNHIITDKVKPYYSVDLNHHDNKILNDEDVMSFKGVENDYWSQNFGNKGGERYYDIDDYIRRNKPIDKNTYGSHSSDSQKFEVGESATEKGFEKKHEFDKHEKGDHKTDEHKEGYEKAGHNSQAFKDFLDTFANRFAAVKKQADNKYAKKNSQDKGEKKKGYHRVYHKDEYKVDNEFYDNNHNSAQAEEKGNGSSDFKDAAGFLQSHVAAAEGSAAGAHHKTGNSGNYEFDKSHSGHDSSQGLEKHVDNFRDIIKETSGNNYIDYDHHRI